eukprot:TRINITY_DN21924_c0_g1_i1.p1 TRINITY_DN21924_c0_g1~~TRINITY_DN21924_c0_g1_i1.p1  ORF type:complete len:372 (+),score=58.75 TRINITY_DN21924_c0_g1_i1:915-2030(+)
MPVIQEDLRDAAHCCAVDMDQRREPYRGMTCRDVYSMLCRQHACKVNSGVVSKLPMLSDDFDIDCLDLTANMVGSKGMIPVMEVARLSKTLRKIILKNNYLDNGAIRSISMALRDHPTVESIDVSGNPISWTAGMHIIDLVSNNQSIQRIDMDGTFLKPNIIETIKGHTRKNQAAKARKKVTGANPTNHPLAIRIRALKRMYNELVTREGAEGKIPKRCAIEGYKENMRMQSRENELDSHSVAFYESLKKRCNADQMGLINWETFLVIAMVDDIGYSEAEVQRIKETFTTYDTDSNGFIDLQELKTMISSISGITPSDEYVLEKMTLFDADGSSTLTLDEFIVLMIDKGPQLHSSMLVPSFPKQQPRVPHH